MKNKNALKSLLPVAAIALLILIAGCTKEKIVVKKSENPENGCAVDKSKFVNKDWYIFSPAQYASQYRYMWDSQGVYWGPDTVWACGTYTWLDDCTFKSVITSTSETFTLRILELRDSYVKLQQIENPAHPEYEGMTFECDNSPH